MALGANSVIDTGERVFTSNFKKEDPFIYMLFFSNSRNRRHVGECVKRSFTSALKLNQLIEIRHWLCVYAKTRTCVMCSLTRISCSTCAPHTTDLSANSGSVNKTWRHVKWIWLRFINRIKIWYLTFIKFETGAPTFWLHGMGCTLLLDKSWEWMAVMGTYF